MNDRPCTCGCSFKEHAEIKFKDNKPSIFYCRNCNTSPPSWCYNYRPLNNLEYLEWLTKNDK